MEVSEKMMEFVRSHANDDVSALRLKYSGKDTLCLGFSLDFALIQIEARRKARKKLPTYIENSLFLFPSIIAEEQASNEAVARFHASLLPHNSSILDLTAGLGIDDFEFCKAGMVVTSCEIDRLKCDILRHNSEILCLDDRISIKNCNSIDFIQNNSFKYDAVFADPARRNNSGGRVHALADCQPDILGNLPEILGISGRLLVKASPLLDISLIRNSVSDLTRIYVVCFRGECKEVLIDISPKQIFKGITVVDLDWDKGISEFHFHDHKTQSDNEILYFSGKDPSTEKYLYEPNAGIMKVADWQVLCRVFPDLRKCAPNTHIFLSNTLYPDFPGRVLEISSVLEKRELKRLKGTGYNVVARNYPLSAPEIIRKYSIVSGGPDYLYAFKCGSVPTILKAKLIKPNQV